MKKPYQKLCGTYHEVREPCPAGICLTPAAAFAAAQVDPIYVPVRRKIEPLVEKTDNVSLPHLQERVLTPAERQKRYREKHGDSYREANRLRMRKSRE